MDQPRLRARFVMVRHGESQVMVNGVIGGRAACTGLSDLGQRQAAALRDRFAGGGEPDIDVVYSSPLPRALETTTIVLPALGDHEIHTMEDLEEFRFGQADGLPWEEARKQFGPWNPWHDDPYQPIVVGGDSRAGFRHRVAHALSEIASRHDGATVFVGCHGGVVGSALAMAFGVNATQTMADLPTSLTSITELEFLDHPQRGAVWRLVRYNDDAHARHLSH